MASTAAAVARAGFSSGAARDGGEGRPEDGGEDERADDEHADDRTDDRARAHPYAEVSLDAFLSVLNPDGLIEDAADIDEELMDATKNARRKSGQYPGALDQLFIEIVRYRLLTPVEEQELGKRAQRGDEAAIHLLVKHNLRFVVSVAKKYQNRGLPLTDLIREGNSGLMTAAKKFDPTVGVKFITYAVWWVRQAILAALAEQGRVVRIPLNRSTDMSLLLEAKVQFQVRLRRAATVSELSKATGITEDTVKKLLAVQESPLRLDAPLRVDSDQSVGERVPLTVEASTSDLTRQRELRRHLDEALTTMPPRDAKVLRLYFGLDGGREHTLEQIGELLGITRERVRQLRDRAVKKARTGPMAEALRAHWEDSTTEPELTLPFVSPKRQHAD